jgi:hypothetical protein
MSASCKNQDIGSCEKYHGAMVEGLSDAQEKYIGENASALGEIKKEEVAIIYYDHGLEKEPAMARVIYTHGGLDYMVNVNDVVIDVRFRNANPFRSAVLGKYGAAITK